ncbi:hypothetical protein EVG20_g2126 [Dentipellis fragilis]|uniref:BTB domain-containing protein n=1 Tax=Dentipellis fragilis TaxID=205917 RepID=A0A4Y9Z9R2_9AGAM|nr:hypothetical protein EVG20_g2126 [Dentipellis fragilis]
MEPTQWNPFDQYVSKGLNAPSGEKPPERPMLATSVSQSRLITPPVCSSLPSFLKRRAEQKAARQDSNAKTPEGERREMISISVTFYPGSTLDSLPSDLVLLTSDSVFFYVHSHKLLSASDNGFNAILPRGSVQVPGGTPPLLAVPEDSTVLNIILHTIYNMSAAQFSPATQSIVAAVDAMATYGIPAKSYIAPSTPLYLLLLANAAINPIEIYALAASLDIPELAVDASSHLLSYPLPSLTDELTAKMGPIYFKRLVFLHLGRIEALKRLLLSPPASHPYTQICGSAEQTALTRAWALASAYFAWEAQPDLSITAMEAALYPLGDHLVCNECKRLLKERVTELAMQWALVKIEAKHEFVCRLVLKREGRFDVRHDIDLESVCEL